MLLVACEIVTNDRKISFAWALVPIENRIGTYIGADTITLNTILKILV